MTSKETLNTHQKALEINLDPTSYGSFAEIGAGQEVARWFLVVGGASGRGARSCFFSFVDTISAPNYAGTNEPHGWVGLRFQLHPGDQPSDIVLHINNAGSF